MKNNTETKKEDRLDMDDILDAIAKRDSTEPNNAADAACVHQTPRDQFSDREDYYAQGRNVRIGYEDEFFPPRRR